MTETYPGSRETVSKWAGHMSTMVSGAVLLVTGIPRGDADTLIPSPYKVNHKHLQPRHFL